MRITLLFSLSLLLAACGGKDKSEPTTPTPDPVTEEPSTEEPAMMSPEACEGAGGTVVGDIGDGSVACPPDTNNIGNVSGGVEQQLCCQPATADGAE